MQVPSFKNSSYHSYLAILENTSSSNHSHFSIWIPPWPPSFSGMIDSYLTQEIGERMGVDCLDLLKNKSGLPSSCEKEYSTLCDQTSQKLDYFFWGGACLHQDAWEEGKRASWKNWHLSWSTRNRWVSAEWGSHEWKVSRSTNASVNTVSQSKNRGKSSSEIARMLEVVVFNSLSWSSKQRSLISPEERTSMLFPAQNRVHRIIGAYGGWTYGCCLAVVWERGQKGRGWDEALPQPLDLGP